MPAAPLFLGTKGRKLISLQNVTVTYNEVLTPIDCLTMVFPRGVTAIMGPSGSGKSTLLRVVAGLQKPTKGRALIDDEPVKAPTWTTAGDSRVALIHQDYRLVPFLTVGDNIRLAGEMRNRELHDDVVRESMDRVGLAAIAMNRTPSTLSGGEQQRIAIARSLVSGATVLLADEPTGALDARNTAIVADVLVDLATQGIDVLIATHDESVASATGSLMMIEQGELVAR